MMDERTLEALRGSIEKWRRIVEENCLDLGTDNCPLCTKFYSESCSGCPVMSATGRTFCSGSPYEDWIEAGGGYGTLADTIYRLAAARRELAFLRSLMPPATSLITSRNRTTTTADYAEEIREKE